MPRPTLIRTKDKSSGRLAKGKYAVGIDHRSGFKVPYKKLKFEPGTNYFVTREESDEEHNLVTDVLNFSPEKKIERIALRWSFPDVTLSIGAIVSDDEFNLPAGVSTNFMYIDYSALSVAPGLQGLDFSDVDNSQYYILIFQGI